MYAGKDVLVAVPARDILLLATSGNLEGLNKMVEKVRSVHSTGDHLQSRWILKRSKHQWSTYLFVN